MEFEVDGIKYIPRLSTANIPPQTKSCDPINDPEHKSCTDIQVNFGVARWRPVNVIAEPKPDEVARRLSGLY